ncbi:MAG: hypothetical protein DRJ03_10885 [Chloroflexi bacterium]|nr:MAG: hypothetical protein DRJ03_10885 [Chloroflexota bacterium]
MEQVEIPGTEPLPEKTYTVVCQEVWHRETKVVARTKQEALLQVVALHATTRTGAMRFERDLRPDNWKVEVKE